jgi:predicted helicase
MMGAYTIAHLKLGLTLKNLGVDDIGKRLGIYLTNSLEEGIPTQPDLFSFGLAGAVTEEATQAAEIKTERPIMVIIGNPPYSVSSSNKGEHIQNLIKVYKQDLNERKINLDDDYIKFIRFSEDMISMKI